MRRAAATAEVFCHYDGFMPLEQRIYEELVRELSDQICAQWRQPAVPAPVCETCQGPCTGLCARGHEMLAHGACRLSACPPTPRLEDGIAAFIDHTLLKPEASREQIRQICAEARQFNFASVCVNPGWIALVAKELRGTPVRACSVIGFPLGATLTETKRAEALACLRLGADELDMVMNVGALKSGDEAWVEQDIRAVVAVAHATGAAVKVILETGLLEEREKIRACQLARAAGADFVKTSTGFGPGGATAADIALMRATVGDCMGVKASGGVRTLEDARKMVAAGASRVGASASVKIVAGEASAAGPGY